ncbi:hypothetical protein PHISCL_07854 [Aspergillus sclerotialis]|uniref:Uncharacterized protein n=1 Tax=Aspergillus sclerotialis TaxID=2070753 RepID=A0A3A2Z9M6_9EURO|nr:hypothetical protein PHISCL_07854 [Aspergillus sclerotialis]
MPSNPRIPNPSSKLPSILIPRPPRLCILPVRSVLQPAVYFTPNQVHARLKGSVADEKWTGSSTSDHTVNRVRKHDETDPETAASAYSIKERDDSHNIADDSKSQATTERDGLKYGRKAKEEHPKAPEPVIGMNDERAEKGH